MIHTRQSSSDTDQEFNKTNDSKIKEKINKELFQTPKLKKEHQPKIFAPFVGFLQADLMLTSDLYPNSNNKVKYLFNVIDIYSRYAWSFPLNDKKADTILKHLKKVHKDLKDNDYNFYSFTTDDGSEFKGSVAKYLKDNNVIQYLVKPLLNRGTTMMVERYNQTIAKIIVNSFAKSVKWVNKINSLLETYRERKHSMIKLTPKEVFIDKKKTNEKRGFIHNKKDQQNLPFKPGDKVLLQIKLDKFVKPTTNMRWYPIPLEIIGKDSGYRYKVKNLITEDYQKYTPISTELKKVTNEIAEGLIKHHEYFEKLLNESRKDKQKRRVRRQISELIDDTVLEVTDDNEIVRKTRMTPEHSKHSNAIRV